MSRVFSFRAISVAFAHTVFAIIAGFSVIFLLEATLASERPTLIEQWHRYVRLTWQALRDDRSRNFVMLTIVFAVTLPFVGALTTLRDSTSSSSIALKGSAMAIAAIIVYYCALHGLIQTSTYRITVLSRALISWHWFILIAWTLLSIPLLQLTNAIRRQFIVSAS